MIRLLSYRYLWFKHLFEALLIAILGQSLAISGISYISYTSFVVFIGTEVFIVNTKVSQTWFCRLFVFIIEFWFRFSFCLLSVDNSRANYQLSMTYLAKLFSESHFPLSNRSDCVVSIFSVNFLFEMSFVSGLSDPKFTGTWGSFRSISE